MGHYFDNDETLIDHYQTWEVRINQVSLKMTTNRGVFSKGGLDYGTRVLLETIQIEEKPLSILDLGCGYGPIGIYLAKSYPNAAVTMIDVNERALDLAKINAQANQVENTLIMQSNSFENVAGTFDHIVTNPPIRAGKEIVFKLYEDSYAHLKKNGYLWVVIQKKQGAPSSLKKLESMFDSVEISSKNSGYWVFCAKK